MLRLCSHSSRSYPGRSAPHAGLSGAASGNGCRDGAEVSKSHSRCGRCCQAMQQLETSPAEPGKPYPTEGPNEEEEVRLNELS
jgi:hypothetical protein